MVEATPIRTIASNAGAEGTVVCDLEWNVDSHSHLTHECVKGHVQVLAGRGSGRSAEGVAVRWRVGARSSASSAFA